jgi:hypothetical protein
MQILKVRVSNLKRLMKDIYLEIIVKDELT